MGLLNKPANNGVAEAQFVLGYLLLNGEGGVKQDVPHALSMIEMAGNSGFQKAKWFVCFLLACPVSWQVASVFCLMRLCSLVKVLGKLLHEWTRGGQGPTQGHNSPPGSCVEGACRLRV